MKRKGAERVYQMVKDMTPEEEAAFWRRGTEELRKEIEQRKLGKEQPSH
jgi:hypothetical protein